jgi:hypothetical protein
MTGAERNPFSTISYETISTKTRETHLERLKGIHVIWDLQYLSVSRNIRYMMSFEK